MEDTFVRSVMSRNDRVNDVVLMNIPLDDGLNNMVNLEKSTERASAPLIDRSNVDEEDKIPTW